MPKVTKNLIILQHQKYGYKITYDSYVKTGGPGHTKVQLNYADIDTTWNRPGQKACDLVDTGNGFRVTFYTIDLGIESVLDIDYCQAERLRVLLKLENDEDSITTFNRLKY